MDRKNKLTNWMKWRLKKNKNVIAVVTGQTGSGKSWSAISLGCGIADSFGTNFSIEGNVAFNFTDLLEKTMRPENTKPGTPFVFEEVGSMASGSSAREWQSKTNKFFFSFLQTTRHRNQILLFTTPMFSFLESGARSLCHLHIVMLGYDQRKRESYIKPYQIQVNQRTGKFYFKLIRYKEGEMKQKLVSQSLSAPPDHMIKEYELIKSNFTAKMNVDIIRMEKERMDKEGFKDKPKDLTPIQSEVYKYLKEGLDNDTIAKKIEKSVSYIKALRITLKKKGWNIEKEIKSDKKVVLL